MSKPRIAAQMFTVREFTKTRADFEETLGKLSAMGFQAVQMSAIGCMNGDDPEVDAAAARAMLDHHGLSCIATHRPLPALLEDLDAEIEFHKTLGCPFVAIGGYHGGDSRSAAGAREFLARIAPVLDKLGENDLLFGYHNHAHEYCRSAPGEPSFFEVLVAEGPSALHLEMDLYWVEHAGFNCVRWLERVPGRASVIHIKDKGMVPDQREPVMTPIGEGNLDWAHILPACDNAKVDWIAIEQDRCLRDPFDCLRSSLEFLQKMGYSA